MGLSRQRLERVHDWMRRQIDDGRLAGLSVTILRQGKAAFSETAGLADIAQRQPMRDDTIMRILSMTKTITGIALMTLYEEGHFQLDDAIDRWLPTFTNQRVLTGGARGRWEMEPARVRSLCETC